MDDFGLSRSRLQCCLLIHLDFVCCSGVRIVTRAASIVLRGPTQLELESVERPVISAAITIILHQVFTRIFYVPLPQGSWWQGG